VGAHCHVADEGRGVDGGADFRLPEEVQVHRALPSCRQAPPHCQHTGTRGSSLEAKGEPAVSVRENTTRPMDVSFEQRRVKCQGSGG